MVTGSNKGIGLGIVRSLCQHFDGEVFLTSRNVERGQAAVKLLQSEGMSPKYHQMDVTDIASIKKFYQFIANNYDGIDVLVNNAGVMIHDDDPGSFYERIAQTLSVNYYGVKSVYQILLPLLKYGARVVNISSQTSIMAMGLCSEDVRSALNSPSLSLKELDMFIEKYQESSKNGRPADIGFPDNPIGAYMVSKAGVSLVTMIFARQLNESGNPKKILINACCPGYIDTDLTKRSKLAHMKKRTTKEAAVTPTYLALLPLSDEERQGKFFMNKKDATDKFFLGNDPAVRLFKSGRIKNQL